MVAHADGRSPARPVPHPWQVIGSAAAGAICWVLDFFLLWFLTFHAGVAVSLAAVIAFLSAGLLNYLLNHTVFAGRHEARTAGQVARYALLTGANVLVIAVAVPLIEALFSALTGHSELSLLLAKFSVTAALLVPNALAYRRWVFAVGR